MHLLECNRSCPRACRLKCSHTRTIRSVIDSSPIINSGRRECSGNRHSKLSTAFPFPLPLQQKRTVQAEKMCPKALDGGYGWFGLLSSLFLRRSLTVSAKMIGKIIRDPFFRQAFDFTWQRSWNLDDYIILRIVRALTRISNFEARNF